MSKAAIPMKKFHVSGKVLLPGTREVRAIEEVVVASSPDTGAIDLAAKLHGRYKKDMDRDHAIKPSFARIQLNWKELPQVEVVKKVAEVSLPESAVGPSGPVLA
jgi:hypothetical protein